MIKFPCASLREKNKHMNKKYILKLAASSALLLSTLSLTAQFELSGVVRPRFELRDGYSSPKTENSEIAAFTSQRTRLSFDFKNDKLKTRFTVFDARTWGDQVWKKDEPSMGLHEAWAELKLCENAVVKFGRQELKYDNSRLVSPVNWNQIGAAHDALFFKYRKDGFEMDLGTAWSQSSSNPVSGTDYSSNLDNDFYKNLNIIWLSKKLNDLTLSSLSIIDGYEQYKIDNVLDDNGKNVQIEVGDPNVSYYRYTTGLKVDYKVGDFQAIGRVFYQGGKDKSGKDLTATFYNADITYKVSDKFKVLAGVEVMSGNDVEDEKYNAFDICYGGRHGFNGRMDYYSIPKTTKGAGLLNPYVKADYSFNKETKLTAEVHNFSVMQDKLSDGTELDSKGLGNEIDFTFTKKFDKAIELSAGYSMMFGTETMEIIKGGDKDKFNQWAFVMVSVTPSLFKSSNE